MIKCKLADQGEACPKSKDICCHECEEKKTCNSACIENEPTKCEDAIFTGSNEIEVFQSKAAAEIKIITDIVLAKKDLEAKEKSMKEKLQKVMEEQGIKSFDDGVIKITYIDKSVRNSIDSKKLKEKYPDIASECTKVSNVKAFVKLEVK